MNANSPGGMHDAQCPTIARKYLAICSLRTITQPILNNMYFPQLMFQKRYSLYQECIDSEGC